MEYAAKNLSENFVCCLLQVDVRLVKYCAVWDQL